jgi:hypothetical protein
VEEAAEEKPVDEPASRPLRTDCACSSAVWATEVRTAEAGAVRARLAEAASRDSGVATEADPVVRASLLAPLLEAAAFCPLEDFAFASVFEAAPDSASAADFFPAAGVEAACGEAACRAPELCRAVVAPV